MGGDGANDGGDHMKDAGLGLPEGASQMTLPSFTLESGVTLTNVPVGYSTYGRLNARGDNGVIVGHSLTSNSHVHEWWGEMLGDGPGFTMNTLEEFVVCVNYLGSPYGTASPITPADGEDAKKPYGARFPTPCTIRDNVYLQKQVLDRLGVTHLRLAVGGSMGSMLALEWAATFPDFVDRLILIAGCGRHTDWAIAIGEAERFAVYADARFKGGAYDPSDPPSAGLAAARMTAMLTYRAPRSVDDRHRRSVAIAETNAKKTSVSDAIVETEKAEHEELGLVPRQIPRNLRSSLPRYDVENYLRYQGRKFARRFDPNCYVSLTHTLDTHDVSRGRGTPYEAALRSLPHDTLVVGITSDALYPFHLQKELVTHMPNAKMYAIDSKHGHDAFLIEIADLNAAAVAFRGGKTTRNELDGTMYGTADTSFLKLAKAALRVDCDVDSEILPRVATRPARRAVNTAPGELLISEASRRPYASDMGHQPPALPDAVALPNTTKQVAALVRLCHERRVPVTTRGAGTGLEGGAVAYAGGLVVDTSRLKLLEFDEENQTCLVGAGVLKNELDLYLKPRGVLFGPDPSSNPSIGGMASTGGSGMSTLKYGTSKENVRSMTVVTPRGDVLQTRRATRKSSTGYELNALYLGAEGTLGIITELIVRTFPRPKRRVGAVVTFADVRSASSAVVEATQSANLETLLRCELLNDEGVECTNAVFKTRLAKRPTLFLEFISAKRSDDPAPLNDWETFSSIAERHGAVSKTFAKDGESLDQLWDARRGCYLAALKYRGVVDGSGRKEKVYVGDVCVPVSKLSECAAETEKAFKQAGFPCVMCAHISDGNFHCLVPFLDEEADKLEALNDKVIKRALALGGAASGEHGVGVGKMKHMLAEHGPFHLETQRSIKRALDPRNIMNPGKVVPMRVTEEERQARHALIGGPGTGSSRL